MQHERVFSFARHTVNDLRVAARPEGRHDQSLCLTAGKHGGPMRARYCANLDIQTTHGARVTPVNPGMSVQHTTANNPLLQLGERARHIRCRPLGVFVFTRQFFD